MPFHGNASGDWFKGFLILVCWDLTKHSSLLSLICVTIAAVAGVDLSAVT